MFVPILLCVSIFGRNCYAYRQRLPLLEKSPVDVARTNVGTSKGWKSIYVRTYVRARVCVYACACVRVRVRVCVCARARARERKGIAVPLQAWTNPEGSRKLRFPDFVTTARDGGRLSALRTGRLYPQEILLVLISVRGWVDPRAIVRSEGFNANENPLTPAGIEPATFQFVVQHLNHCVNAVPLSVITPWKMVCNQTQLCHMRCI